MPILLFEKYWKVSKYNVKLIIQERIAQVKSRNKKTNIKRWLSIRHPRIDMPACLEHLKVTNIT